ncbi:MAG: hypothetical protein HYT89_04315 [Candidatus Omnitrophica bacterium]|nr:hypothetical protein [Candidatus Omnitrophota bacterium]
MKLTQKRRENLARLMTNASTIIFGGLIIGPFMGDVFKVKAFVAGSALYLVCAVAIWCIES